MKRTMEIDSVNALQKLLTGNQAEDNSAVLEKIEQHGVKLTIKNTVAISALRLLNDYFKADDINEWIDNYLALRQLSPESNKDLMKAIDVMSNKKLLEKMTVGMNVRN